MNKDVISLSISVLLLFRHYISHKITMVPRAVAGYYAVLSVLLFLKRLILKIMKNTKHANVLFDPIIEIEEKINSWILLLWK